MSRLNRFAFSLASGYASLGANILFSLFSVPLAMHYLSTAEFGLWVLAAQVAAYLGLIELGMMGSIGRILIDHKDDRNGGDYGSTIKTGALVLFVQGLLLAAAGVGLSLWLAWLFDVPATLTRDFQWLLGGQSILLGAFFASRMFGFVLQAHQRYDEHNYAQIVGFAANLLVLWAGFALKLGVFSLLAGNAAAMLVGTACCLLAVRRRRLLPDSGRWGRVNRKSFRGLFSFGTDIFLLSVGQMLISTSQVLVVGRTLGLEVAAVWSVATKMFTVAQQLVWSIFNYSGAAFAEMVVRGERERLRARFRDLVMLTASASVVAGLGVAVCNRSFLELWTHGRIAWGLENDLLMAISVMVYATTRCHTGLTGLTKEIRAMKFLYLLEGGIFVSLGLLTAPRLGLAGIIASGVISNLLCSGVYGVRRTTRYLGITPGEAVGQWLRPPLRLLGALLLAATTLWWTTRWLPAPAQLALNSAAVGLAGAWGFWHLGLPQAMRQELGGLLGRLRQRFSAAR